MLRSMMQYKHVKTIWIYIYIPHACICCVHRLGGGYDDRTVAAPPPPTACRGQYSGPGCCSYQWRNWGEYPPVLPSSIHSTQQSINRQANTGGEENAGARVLQFLEPTGSLAFTLLVGEWVGRHLVKLQTYKLSQRLIKSYLLHSYCWKKLLLHSY